MFYLQDLLYLCMIIPDVVGDQAVIGSPMQSVYDSTIEKEKKGNQASDKKLNKNFKIIGLD